MNIFPQIGKMLILVGALIVLIGLIFLLAGKIPWLGRLPGDITIRKGNYVFFFPIVTCIVISIILSAILFLLRR